MVAKYKMAIRQLRYPEALSLAENSLTSSSTPLTKLVVSRLVQVLANKWGSVRRPTHIDNADVHAERFTGEVGDISHVVAHVPDRDQPVEDGRPDGRPAYELGVYGRVIPDDNIIDGIVE